MTHTVLLVEDEDDLRDMIREVLELNGYAVVAVEEGYAALDAFEHIDHVSLVLLDLVTPGMNGWDFFERMRERPELALIPVVVHSSAPERAPLGVTRVLRKPVEIARLLSLVREYCTG